MTLPTDEAEGWILRLRHRLRVSLVKNRATFRRVGRRLFCHVLVMALILLVTGNSPTWTEVVSILCVVAIKEVLDRREDADR